MSRLEDQVMDIIAKLEIIGEHLYKQETKVAYERLNQAIVELTGVMDSIYIYSKEQGNLVFDPDKLNQNLLEALKAMEAGDTVLLADILQYELVEQLREIKESI